MKMKSGSHLLNMLLVLGVALSATVSAAPLKTVHDGVLSIGSDLTWAPYDYIDKGVPAGFDAELMEKISKGMGLTMKIEDTRFANLILGITGHHYDVIASALYITPARAKQIDYLPYMKTGGALLTTRDSKSKPETPEDLCGLRLASLKGAAWVPMINKISTEHCVATGKKPIVLQEYASTPLAAQALLARAADVQFDDAAVAKMMVDKNGDRLTITSKKILQPVVIGLGVAKGNEGLLKTLEQQLEKLKQSGQYQALLKKYNLEEPSAEEIAAAYAGQ